MKNENPLAEENIGVKVKRVFTKKNKEQPSEAYKSAKVAARLIGMNNMIPICAQACACCWDKEVPEEYADKAIYIGKRTVTGHTSILEHSNLIIYLYIDKVYESELIKFLSCCNYLKTSIYQSSNDGYHCIIGGSLRGYSALYLDSADMANPILRGVTKILYSHAHSCAFKDICKLGIMDETLFLDAEPDEEDIISDIGPSSDKLDIVSFDNINKFKRNLSLIDKEAYELLPIGDEFKFLTTTVLFKDLSRTATHQLVRHRNAITQESQRYVDYTDSSFANPADFKDKYDASHEYIIRFGNSGPLKMTLDKIGTAMCGIYRMLHDKRIAGGMALDREDARAFLPSNVKCRKLYMTFTYKSLAKFFELRCNRAAQAEIRGHALELSDMFFNSTDVDKGYLNDSISVPAIHLYRMDKYSDRHMEFEEISNDKSTELEEVSYIESILGKEEDINEDSEEK